MKTKYGYGGFPVIKCPYCFAEFTHVQVCFKAKTVFAEQDLEELELGKIEDYSQYSIGKEAEKKRILRKFVKSEDQKYKNFWREYPNSEPEWEQKENAVITPDSVDMMENTSGYGRDASGFVDHVVDYFGKVSRTRICPECHNRLPRGYGKMPVYFISVVGAVHSGKTVFLSQLMKNLDVKISEIGMAAFREEGIDEFLKANPVESGQDLPPSTLPEQLSEPLFYLIEDERQSFGLVFYDIAGENCVNVEKMEKFGPFIRNSHGIILLIDPAQFPMLCSDHRTETAEPESVIRTMRSAFISPGSVNGKWDTPVAVVLSKSDRLNHDPRLIPDTLSFWNDICYTEQKYNRDVSCRTNRELTDVYCKMPRGRLLLKNLNACFSCYSLFAVSMLEHGEQSVETTSGEKRNRPEGSPDTIRLEEPLFWILDQYGLLPADGQKVEKYNKNKEFLLKKIVKRFWLIFGKWL